MPNFVHLHAHSAFSFLSGASSVEGLVLRAAQLGHSALALTDTNSVTGVVALSRRCAKAGIKPLGGCEVILEGGHRLTLLADGPAGWSSLCQLLTAAHLRDPERKGARVRWEDLEANAAGLVCLSGDSEHGHIAHLLHCGRYREAADLARRHLILFGPSGYAVEVTRTLREGERRLSNRLFQLADYLRVPAVATNPVRHATKMGLVAHEALCRVRLGLKPDEQHADLPINGEQYLKSADQIATLFADRPDALENAVRLAERLAPPLDPTARHLPAFSRLPPGESAFSHLAALTWCGAQARYKERMTDEVKARLVHELETVQALGYADYFLVCWDVCRQAKKRNIGFGLRGSAVGSAVAYSLYMSGHDPIARRVSFERFLSRARAKPPDIDIDFRHDLRDEMMNYVRQTYGEDRVANVSNYVTYRGRSLLRDLGKALGFDTAEVDRLRELLGHCRGDDIAERIETAPELRALGIEPERYGDLFALCAQLAGLPRHLGTHSSGLIVSDVPLAGVVPLQWAAKGVTVAALDKDDVEAAGIGLLKMDQLSLRTLTAVDIAVSALQESDPAFDYADRDREDPDALAMIRAAETVGVFQLESPAQMALQWRLQADKFDDLVASVALIRPGPLLGGSVEPYVWRRKGWQPVTYPLPELEPVLKETYGRILFQDQVLDVARVVGGFTPDEADVWLKAMTHARDEAEMTRLGLELRDRAKGKGLTGKAFEKLWRQIKGFSRYGFCQGHAVAFADHAQGTAWLLRHHPAEFLAAILSVEPCGFWPVSVVVAEAERRNVRALGPCVNRSNALCWTVERPSNAPGGRGVIRCALSYVRSLGSAAAEAIEAERQRGGLFVDLAGLCRRCAFLDREQLEWLALSGALDALTTSRRRALWSLPALAKDKRAHGRTASAAGTGVGQGALGVEVALLLPPDLPDFDAGERFGRQWAAIGFSPDGHPLQFHRDALAASGVLPCAALQQQEHGATVTLAGLVVRPHRPPTPSGQPWVFFTLEDESGLSQVTVSPDVYERLGPLIYGCAALVVSGMAERRGVGVILRADQAQSLA